MYTSVGHWATVLYGECEAKVERQEVIATDAQLDQLEEYSDPAFTAKLQYIQLVQSMPGYCRLKLQPCSISFADPLHATIAASHGISAGPINLNIGLEGFYTAIGQDKAMIEFKHIRRWTLPDKPGAFAECEIALELSVGADRFGVYDAQ